MTPLQITLIILLRIIVTSLSGKVPFSTISARVILVLILTGVTKSVKTLSGFINTNVVMSVAMFVIGATLAETNPLDRAQKLVVHYKNNPRTLILISSLVAGFLACLTSAIATAAIMIPLLVGVANEVGTSRSKMLFPTMAIVNIATTITFLGQGASNMTWNDVVIKAGASTPLSIWDFTIARIPILLISSAYMVFIGYRLMPDTGNSQSPDNIQEKDTVSQLTPSKEEVTIVLILGTITCMLPESVIGIKMYLTASIGTCLLALYGVLSEYEALGPVHQPAMFLFVGVLALSDVIKITGVGDIMAGWMILLSGNTTNPYVITAVFFIIPFTLTQVMFNLVTITIFIPLIAATCVKIGVDPRAAVIGILVAGSASILAPIAAPCQIMIMGLSGYSLRDYLKCGTSLAAMITIACIFTPPIVFPFY